MSRYLVLSILFCCVNVVFLVEDRNTGSGTDGNLRLCIVEGRGSYKRGSKFCPVLDEEKSGIECVIGTDRLDCLRRISKGTVDLGAFGPEDMVAAKWAEVDVLVTNEIRLRNRPFARSIVAVVNRRILDGSTTTSVPALLRNRTLCHPAADADDLKPLSETVAKYLESLVTKSSCDPELSLTENRIRDTANFFEKACMAGPWVPNKVRDAELKRKYPSLCAACASRGCSSNDPYWGDIGALACLAAGAGDVTWADLDDVKTALLKGSSEDQFALLCRDGTWQPLNASPPCVWLQQPWNIIVAKTKSAERVRKLMATLTDNAVVTDRHWRGALAALLEIHQPLPPPLQPAQNPWDYLSNAHGFIEAYSIQGCQTPRHITLCTTSVVASSKCDWLAEAGQVYGVSPPLQCARRTSLTECLEAVSHGQATAVLATSDSLPIAVRNYSLQAVLHEATPIIDKMETVSAYVHINSKLKKISDLRNKRVAFPSFDGFAFHSVLRYFSKSQNTSCKDISKDYFSEICAPGIENYNVSKEILEKYTKNCYKNGNLTITGEVEALRALVENKVDVAFFSRNTYNMYRSKQIVEPWAKEFHPLALLCPDDNPKYCFVSWSNIGHLFVSKNMTDVAKNEVINVFTKLDQLFGNHAHRLMFSMYGPFQHHLDVLFHNNTRALYTDEMFKMRPYSDIPLNFERSYTENKICQLSDFMTGFGAKSAPAMLLVTSLVLSVLFIS